MTDGGMGLQQFFTDYNLKKQESLANANGSARQR